MFRKPDSKRPAMSATEKRALVLKNLVASEAWIALQEECEILIGQYSAPVPRAIPELIGYNTFSILRDGIGQLLNQIEERAKAAPDPANYDPTTTGEQVLDVKPL